MKKKKVENPNNVKVIVDQQIVRSIFREVQYLIIDQQNFLKIIKHIGVYAFRREALLNFSPLK